MKVLTGKTGINIPGGEVRLVCLIEMGYMLPGKHFSPNIVVGQSTFNGAGLAKTLAFYPIEEMSPLVDQ